MMRKEKGYSLVEVLVATAITGFVLLTVVTLFYMGRRNVYSGKQMSFATSVGTRMLEDLSSLTAPELEASFAITDASGTPGVTVDFPNSGTTYAKAIKRDTNNIDLTTTDPGKYLTAWKSLIGSQDLSNAEAGLIMTPMQITTTSQPWTSAQMIKVRAYVAWDEGTRRRYAYFDSTKSNR